jgi:hypothetical protein
MPRYLEYYESLVELRSSLDVEEHTAHSFQDRDRSEASAQSFSSVNIEPTSPPSSRTKHSPCLGCVNGGNGLGLSRNILKRVEKTSVGVDIRIGLVEVRIVGEGGLRRWGLL